MKRGYSIHKIAFLSIMLALAIVLGYAESFIPSWVPGVKLGLANLVILILLYTCPLYEAFLVSLLRVFIVALLRGSIFQMPFYMSLAGAVLSFAFMCLAHFLFENKLHCLTIYGVSLLGAFMHSLAQVGVAAIFVEHGFTTFFYFPFISLLSLTSGFLMSFVAEKILQSQPLKKMREEE